MKLAYSAAVDTPATGPALRTLFLALLLFGKTLLCGLTIADFYLSHHQQQRKHVHHKINKKESKTKTKSSKDTTLHHKKHLNAKNCRQVLRTDARSHFYHRDLKVLLLKIIFSTHQVVWFDFFVLLVLDVFLVFGWVFFWGEWWCWSFCLWGFPSCVSMVMMASFLQLLSAFLGAVFLITASMQCQ